MDKYSLIYEKMQSDEYYTAKQLGVYPATMTAMVNRGLVEKMDTTPRTYRKLENTKLLQIKENAEEGEFFGLFNGDEKLGTLCYLKNGTVYSYEDKIFNVAHVTKMRIKDTIYMIG